jgi:hypothetical protein
MESAHSPFPPSSPHHSCPPCIVRHHCCQAHTHYLVPSSGSLLSPSTFPPLPIGTHPSVPITITVIIPPSSLFLSLFSYFQQHSSYHSYHFSLFPIPIGVWLCFWSMCQHPTLAIPPCTPHAPHCLATHWAHASGYASGPCVSAQLCHSSLCSPHTLLFGYMSGACINIHYPDTQYTNKTLACHGFIGATPDKPVITFSYKLFEI